MPGANEVVLQADPFGSGRVGPEVVKGGVERRVELVVVGKPVVDVFLAFVLDRPTREAHTFEFFAVHALVHLDLRQDSVRGKHLNRFLDVIDIGFVEYPRFGLQCLPHHAEADRVESDRLKKRGVFFAKSCSAGIVRRALVDHVRTVNDHHTSVRVGDPAPCVTQRKRRRSPSRGDTHRRGEDKRTDRCQRAQTCMHSSRHLKSSPSPVTRCVTLTHAGGHHTTERDAVVTFA